MKKIIIAGWLWFCLLGCEPQPYKGITIATAANMQFAMQTLTKVFEQTKKIKCRVVVGSSGKLTAQIKEGAPYDVLVSADMKYPKNLHQAGLCLLPKTYAWGKLVLWSQKTGFTPNLENLRKPSLKHLAVANPKTAPYGVAAVEVLKQKGLYDQLKPKLVYGESIAQTNQFIVSQTVDAGFTAKSVVLSPRLQNKGKWVEVDASLYSPIAQGAAVILGKSQVNLSNASAFVKFLSSPTARRILQQYGYSTNQPSTE